MEEELRFRRRIVAVLCFVAVLNIAGYAAYIVGFESEYMKAHNTLQSDYMDSD